MLGICANCSKPADTCDGPVSAATIPATPPFIVAFGTAQEGSKFLALYFTRDGNACPITWQTSVEMDRDLAIVTVAVPLVNDSFLGTYAVDPGGDYAIADDADIWADYLPKGSTLLSSQTERSLDVDSGTVTIKELVDGVHVAGNVTVQFSNTSSPVTFDFDIPFCNGTADACK
jgi:hypothetical protein